MLTSTKQLICALAALVATVPASRAQEARAGAPSESTKTTVATPAISSGAAAPSAELAPTKLVQVSPVPARPPASVAPVKPAPTAIETPAVSQTTADSVTESGGVGVREFQGDDVGQVLRLLARQAKINMVVSEAVAGTVTMRLEDVTALQAIAIIVKSKGLFMDQIDNVYYIKTGAERTAEPTESDSYQFSYGRAKNIAPLLASQLSSKDPPQVDERTNTIFYRETRSNIDNVRKLLVQIDKPTKQVMIESRLVEVNANPKQSYGINWAGVVGSATNPQTVTYGGARGEVNPQGNLISSDPQLGNVDNHNFFGNLSHLAAQQFAILTVPQMSITLRALNEDADAEFLANPRIVTADNQEAKIEITRNQPVPQLNFNEQTAHGRLRRVRGQNIRQHADCQALCQQR